MKYFFIYAFGVLGLLYGLTEKKYYKPQLIATAIGTAIAFTGTLLLKDSAYELPPLALSMLAAFGSACLAGSGASYVFSQALPKPGETQPDDK